MAEVPITINGVICDLYGRTITGPVKIVGSASITGLGVGGGPIIPPAGEGNPPGIWPGPGDPDFPGGGKPPGQPPTIWPGPGDPDFPGGGRPPHPPEDVADGQWQWGWSMREGWHPVYVPGDKPQPVPPPSKEE